MKAIHLRLRTLLAAAAMAIAGGLFLAWLVLHLGIYGISAREQHTRPVYALLEYALFRAVVVRGEDIGAPEDLALPQRVERGARQFHHHCQQCHGAPGVPPAPFAFGLTPAPANLMEAARTWPAGHIYWVVRNGIRMTGMPAWAYRLSDEEMWDLVAFVQAMGRMTPQDHAALEQRLGLARHALARTSPGLIEDAAAPDGSAASPGDPIAGMRATERFLCVTCHAIPGVVGANQHVGPPLGGIARRTFIAGFLPNTAENMARWLKNPQQLDPRSAMPPLGLSDQDARDIAAFLATLE